MRKAITPVISIIILLLITISLTGMGWTYMSGYYEAMTAKQINQVYGSGMADQVMVRNTGTADIDPGELRAIVNGRDLPIENAQSIEAGKSANLKFGHGSCREILEGAGESVRVIGPGNSFSYTYPDPDSGAYTINPGGAGFLEVYCDMSTEGGGWTFLGHVNDNYRAGTFFTSPVGTYRTDRADDGTTYSLGFLDEMDDTEMMMTIDTVDTRAADRNNQIVFFRYAVDHIGFNNGPCPCTGLGNFEYKAAIGDSYTSGGTTNACDANRWYTRTVGDSAYLVLFYGSADYGNYWGTGMGGPNGWNHDGWWYVR